VGLFSAILDAVFGSDEQIGGKPVTRLLSVLTDTELAEMVVESTIGFGENNDGLNDAKLLLGGEIVLASGRTIADPFKFTGLTRAQNSTTAKNHSIGTLVFDLSRNASGMDHLRRGFLIDTALGSDLDVIGRNLGLEKCPGITDAQWRAIIKAVAYLPKQTRDAFDKALEALVGAGNFTLNEEFITDPWKVFVEILVALSTDIRGRFLLNGGEPALTTGLFTVDTAYPINHVIRVVDDLPQTRRGYRDGFTDYFAGGAFLGNTITLTVSPGGIGTPVIVDYGAFEAHYLADDETILHDEDFYAYLSDPLLAARCLLDQIRAAGIKVELSAKV